jgi:protein SCO1/2
MRKIALSFAFVGFLLADPAAARISPADYGHIGVTLPDNAALPLNAPVTDLDGRAHRLADFVYQSTVLVFADYTCRNLCGPILDFVVTALEQSGLQPADQFRLLVIGIDPKDTAQDADRMRETAVSTDTGLYKIASFATADQDTIVTLTAALGYRYAYDKADDVYVHPAAAYVLDASGRVVRVLTGIGLSGADMRLALVEASNGKVGTFRDQVRLLCSAFDPVHGAYTPAISRALKLVGAATILALGGGIGLLFLNGRRAA